MAGTTGTAQIGVTGLAVMGRNLARNFARNGFAVAVHNRTTSKTTNFMAAYGDEGTFVAATGAEAFVASLERPRRIVIMVKAGAGTDAVIEELAPLLEPGDILIDGGNAHFADTRRREAALRERGLDFMGTGISGGEEGALNGPSIMPGGSKEAYAAAGPLLEGIAAVVDGTPCCTHIGADGAGHFVKMVHNGIEYADMQLIGEAYDLIRSATGRQPAEIAGIFREWNAGDLESYLIRITAEVLDQVDAGTGQPLVDVIADAAEQKGTGRWTVQVALDLGIPVSGIAEAVFARALSGHTEQRGPAKDLPGATADWQVDDADAFVEDVRKALYASKVIAYAQGFDMIRAGAKEYGWDIDLGACAMIWRGGCIIQARFLHKIKDAYDANPDLPTLMLDGGFRTAMDEAQDPWRRIVAGAAAHGIPVPGFATGLAYYDGLRRDRLPAALIQGLRDYFGAHTYRRTDREGSFHTDWSGDRAERSAEGAVLPTPEPEGKVQPT